MLLIIASSMSLSTATPTWVKSALNRYRRQNGEGEEATPAVVDLHNEEFCVDVSTYGEVVFEASPRERCETTFAKRCETKSDQVSEEMTLRKFMQAGGVRKFKRFVIAEPVSLFSNGVDFIVFSSPWS